LTISVSYRKQKAKDGLFAQKSKVILKLQGPGKRTSTELEHNVATYDHSVEEQIT
jgi:hypothetical protein